MIHTVTVNPALDLTYRVPALRFDDTTRATQVLRAAGGKGINVSRVAERLAHRTVAMGFVGGRAGDEIEDLLRAEGVRTWFTRHEQPTRTNPIVQDDEGRQLRVSGPGARVTPDELEALVAGVFELRAPRFLVLSGSLLPGVPAAFYAELTRRAREDGVPVAVDADRELGSAIDAGAALIKPNQYELARLTGREVRGGEEAVAAARAVLEHGVRTVVVSLGAAGAVWVEGDAAWSAEPPAVEADSALGAGDALLAGALVALARGEPSEQALRLGVACGTATAVTPGTELCHAARIEAVLPQVRVRRLA